MSNTIWAFGDSITFGYGCNEKCTSFLKTQYESYKKEGDDIWPNLLGNLTSYNVKNLSQIGSSNSIIIKTIIENYDLIRKNDIVIIGMSLHGRTAYPKNNRWHTILSTIEGKNNKYNILSVDEYKYTSDEFTKDEIDTMVNNQNLFSDNPLYEDLHLLYFDFLKKILERDIKVRYCKIWNSSMENADRIKDHTKGSLYDFHFSWLGHHEFSQKIYNEILDYEK
jgi:predicted MPP superfamily phosphohydrolase